MAESEGRCTRKPGRPRQMRIKSFNVDTDLELDERFRDFCEITGCSEGQALLSIVALYKYAARHSAAEGSVANLTPEKLAKRCYWKDCTEAGAAIFVAALTQSGFLIPKPELAIADWDDSQPHAKEYQRKRDEREKRKQNQGLS